MNVLLAHNYYGSAAPSGENRAFEAERDMLRRYGHTVHEFVRHSDELRSRGALGAVRGAIATPWNPFAAARLRAVAESTAPDVLHVHNTFPLLSPAVFRALAPEIPRVLTVHNFRLFCPAALPLREDRICTECLDRRSPIPSLRFACYRGSRLATAAPAASVWLHRALATWERHVDVFILLNEYQRALMVRAGLPVARTVVKPNFHPGWPAPIPWSGRQDYAIFAGRLYRAKGVHTVIRAWLRWEGAPELRIVGGGPEESSLRALARSDGRIRFLGARTSSETQEMIARARLLVLPSLAFEGFPMVIGEAFAHATPVAASDIGPLVGVVRPHVNGVTYAAGDALSLLHQVREAWSAPGLLERLSAGARASFERSYSEGVNHDRLVEIYAMARGSARRR